MRALGGRSLAVLEFATGRVDRGLKIDPVNLFMHISIGSDILGNGVEPR